MVRRVSRRKSISKKVRSRGSISLRKKVRSRRRRSLRRRSLRGGSKTYQGPIGPACCSNMTKPLRFIRVHGSSCPPQMNGIKIFNVPKNTYVITLVDPGEILTMHIKLKDILIQDIYSKGHTLYANNNTLPNLSIEGDTFFKTNTFMTEFKKKYPNINFHNHPPGTRMNDIAMDFSSGNCDGSISTENGKGCNIYCIDLDAKMDGKSNVDAITESQIECKPTGLPSSRNSGKTIPVGEIYLSELLTSQGPGVYIINSCRGLTPDTTHAQEQQMRALSA